MSKSIVITAIISSILGAAAGAAGVYIYYRKIYDVNKDREYEMYRDELKEKEELITNLQNQVKEKLAIAKDTIQKEFESKNAYSEVLNDIPDDGPTSEDDIAYVEIEGTETEGTNGKSDEIRFIGPNDYEDDDDYEKEYIKYYAKDQTLVQEGDILELEEFEMCCGDKALKSFGMYGAPDNEVYVRNEHLETDYKIKKYNISYERYINAVK